MLKDTVTVLILLLQMVWFLLVLLTNKKSVKAGNWHSLFLDLEQITIYSPLLVMVALPKLTALCDTPSHCTVAGAV